MPNPVLRENPSEAARNLVEHLRKNPEEAHGDPTALAVRFGLQPEFVRRALARLPSPGKAEVSRGPHPITERADGLVAFMDSALERAAKNPLRFEAIALLLALALSSLVSWLLPRDSANMMTLRAALHVVIFLGSIGLQMAVFFRKRMVRFALYGGLMFGVGTALPMMVMIWLGLQVGQVPTAHNNVEQGFIVFAVGLGMMVVGVVYGGLAALMSVAGGWFHLKQKDQEWERLSRQELLEKYFELQRRLEQSVAAPDIRQNWESWPVIKLVRQFPFLAAIALGFVGTICEIGISAAFGVQPLSPEGSDAFDILNTVQALVAYSLFIIIGFLSGRATRGALAGGAYALATYLACWIPISGYGPAYALNSEHLMFQSLILAFVVFIGALAGVGATIQRRAMREGRLQRNDGATLVAEMLEIQWRLEEDATHVTVLVVDAAKSTAMKVGADPLDVEYSFREYQMWIAESCAEFSGRIHSVAGDGAVVAFPDGSSAMAAARRIQTDLPRFNSEVNRLPKPFRLRLGLHAGRVAGDLNDVQFTEVIDIAAHVEEISPVGGIAATQEVVAHLGHEGFLPLAREIDGQPVFIALVPTEA